jgi:hypothetical protein
MITGELHSQVDKIWNTFWTGGISNPHMQWDKPLMRQYAEYQIREKLLKNPNVVWDMEALKIFSEPDSMFE